MGEFLAFKILLFRTKESDISFLVALKDPFYFLNFIVQTIYSTKPIFFIKDATNNTGSQNAFQH